MKFFAAALGLAAALVPQVAAHYRWTSLIVNGTVSFYTCLPLSFRTQG